MKHPGLEQVIARTLLTDPVLQVLADTGQRIDSDLVTWRSWAQTFGTTAGPWPGMGAAAVTQFQVTVARQGNFAAVFAGMDLHAYGLCEDQSFWQEVGGGNVNFRRLANRGLTVLARRLP